MQVVDNSSAFRMQKGVPLVIPEVNPQAVGNMKAGKGGIIANPNCSTIIALMAVTPVAPCGWRQTHGCQHLPGLLLVLASLIVAESPLPFTIRKWLCWWSSSQAKYDLMLYGLRRTEVAWMRDTNLQINLGICPGVSSIFSTDPNQGKDRLCWCSRRPVELGRQPWMS